LYSYDPENEIFSKTGIEVIDETRKSKLPIDMASMNKIKSIDENNTWIRLKICQYRNCMHSKFDGLSLCNDEVNTGTWTRGDGVYGQIR
jgi:NAD-dependent DNA ligase